MGRPSKYHEIADDLARQISGNSYIDQLPPLRKLAREYNVSLRTVQKAVEILSQRTLVIADSTRGVRIIHHPSSKIIGIFCNFRKNGSNDELFRTLRQLIEADGYEAVFLDVPEKVCSDPCGAFWKYGWADGYISLNGTSDYAIDRCLQSFHMDVVSANRAFRDAPISCVDFDHASLLRSMVEALVARKHRKIALSFTICSARILEDVVGALHEMQKKYSLTIPPEWISNSKYDIDSKIPKEARIARQFDRILSGSQKPDAIICYHRGMRFAKALVAGYGLALGRDIQLLGTGDGEVPEPGFIPIEFSYSALAKGLWHELRTVLQTKDRKSKQTFIEPGHIDFSMLY